MSTRRIVLVLALLSLAVCCFVTAPVLSGEHPWDADKPIDSREFDEGYDNWLPGGIIDTSDVDVDPDPDGNVTEDSGSGNYTDSVDNALGVFDLLRVVLDVYLTMP